MPAVRRANAELFRRRRGGAVDERAARFPLRHDEQQITCRIPPLPGFQDDERADEATELLPHLVEVRVVHERASALRR